ncbi:MAG: hypothetical protein V1738_00190 [Patescibacteria group bacterium]
MLLFIIHPDGSDDATLALNRRNWEESMLVYMNAFSAQTAPAKKPNDGMTDREFALVEKKFSCGKGCDVANLASRIDVPPDHFLVVIND